MRKVPWAVVLALIFGGIAGTMMARDPGYVLVVYENRSIETSLWAALVALLVAYLLLRITLYAVSWSTHASERVRAWDLRRRQRRARALLERGLLQLAEGRYSEARRALLRAVDDSELPVVNLMYAARAAHAVRADTERNALLARARATTTAARIPAALLDAELRLDEGDARNALDILVALRPEAPDQPKLLRLLAEAQAAEQHWRAVLDLVPALQERRALAPGDLALLIERAWTAWLTQQSGRGGSNGTARDAAADLAAVWRTLPEPLRTPASIGAYAQALHRLGADVDAEALLRTAIDKQWNEHLVRCYGRLGATDDATRARQRRSAEQWCTQHPESAAAALAAGHIALLEGDLARARSRLEGALRLAPSADVYSALGQVCQRLGDHQKAASYYALALGHNGVPAAMRAPTQAADGKAATVNPNVSE